MKLCCRWAGTSTGSSLRLNATIYTLARELHHWTPHAILSLMTTQPIHEQLSEYVANAATRVAITRQVLTPKEQGDLAAEAVSSFLELKNIVLTQLPDPQPARDGISTMYGDFTVRPDGRVTFRDEPMRQDLEALLWQAQTRLAAVEAARTREPHE